MEKMRREIQNSVQGMLPPSNPLLRSIYLISLPSAILLFIILTLITL